MKSIHEEETFKCMSSYNDRLEVNFTDVDGYDCVCFDIRSEDGRTQGIVHVHPDEIDRMIAKLIDIKNVINGR